MIKKMLFSAIPLFIILLLFSCTRKPAQRDNLYPVINSIEASPNIVSKGGVVYLNLAVTDPDEDKMYFEWTYSGSEGDFFADETLYTASNTANPCWWKSPAVEGNYQISVTCTDSIGDSPGFVDSNITVSVSIYSLDTIIGEDKFSSPFSMYLDADGNIYVSDPGLSCVHAWKNGNWYSWNFAGLDSDSVWMYDTTWDTTIDTTQTPPETTITAIVDTTFDSLNIFKFTFTTPSAITVDEENHLLYATDILPDSTIFSVYNTGNIGSPSDTLFGFLFRIGKKKHGQSFPVKSPYSLVVHPDSHWLYVSARGSIIAYDSTSFYEGWVKHWSYSIAVGGVNFEGRGMNLFNDTLYFASFGTDAGYAYSVVRRFIDITNPNGPTVDDANFWISDSFTAYLNGIAIADEGHIFVTEGGGSLHSYHRVVEYDENGSYVRSFGSLGEGDDQFNFPTDIFIDSDGRIYVVDMGNACIKVFKK